MVNLGRRMLLTLGALACLGSCHLDVGIFPERLMAYEAYADLAKYIAPDHIWSYELQIIRDSRSEAGNPEYLVLVDNDGSYGDDCLVVFDTDLKVLGRYTKAQLDALDTVEPIELFKGRRAMVDALGAIVVGNRRFMVDAGKLVYADDAPRLGEYGVAILDPTVFDPNIADIRTEGDILKYRRCTEDWTSVTEQSYDIGPLPWYKIANVALRDTDIVFVLAHDADPPAPPESSVYAHILLLTDNLFATGGLITTGSGLVDNYDDFPVPSSGDIWWQTLGYTDEGFAAFRWGAIPEYYLFDTAGTELDDSGEVPENERPYDQRHVYGRRFGWYVLDMKEMTLERRKWWWSS